MLHWWRGRAICGFHHRSVSVLYRGGLTAEARTTGTDRDLPTGTDEVSGWVADHAASARGASKTSREGRSIPPLPPKPSELEGSGGFSFSGGGRGGGTLVGRREAGEQVRREAQPLRERDCALPAAHGPVQPCGVASS